MTSLKPLTLSTGCSRQEYWSGLPCPSPRNLPDPGIEPLSLTSPALTGRFFSTSTTWSLVVTVHRVTKSWSWLKQFSKQAQTSAYENNVKLYIATDIETLATTPVLRTYKLVYNSLNFLFSSVFYLNLSGHHQRLSPLMEEDSTFPHFRLPSHFHLAWRNLLFLQDESSRSALNFSWYILW